MGNRRDRESIAAVWKGKMSRFYADALNKEIKWDRALSYVRDCIHGEPKDFLETELSFERKLAAVQH
jgi:hypothetical protein